MSLYCIFFGQKPIPACTPVVAFDNTCPILQVIWRGKSVRCTPRGIGPAAGVYHDFAEKKCQTRLTFQTLLGKVQQHLQQKRNELGLPQSAPAILVVDNVSSHGKDGLSRPGPSEHLWASPEHPGLYFMYGLPNLSHCCNPGDQAVNLSLRQCVRTSTKLRAVHHYLQVWSLSSFMFASFSLSQVLRGQLPPRSRLEFGEAAMKPLLVGWITTWLQHAKLADWVKSSWDVILGPVPDSGTAFFAGFHNLLSPFLHR